MNFNDMIKADIQADGIAILHINMLNEPTNLLTFDFLAAYKTAVASVFALPEVRGIVLVSDKKDFIAGGDLRAFANPPADKSAIWAQIQSLHAAMRETEKYGRPIVAAIAGNALGGGLELALACHARFALNNPKIKIGLPEVQLGLIPGGGGTQRLARLVGLSSAITYILQSQLFSPEEALKAGIINGTADTPEAVLQAAKAWINENPAPVQPWDNKAYRIPQGGLASPTGYSTMAGAIGNLRKQTHGHYPGAEYALAAIHDAISLPIDRALEVEGRYFLKALYSKEAGNLIRTGFFAINDAKKAKSRPANIPPFDCQKVGILGAGMMGAGIAYVSALAGINVVLTDISQAAAEAGKAYSTKLLAARVAKAKLSQAAADEILARIICTDDHSILSDCDLIIEAVFEDLALKNQLIAKVEPLLAEGKLAEGKIFASNTSTLPISQLAKASTRPANFIGLHFFSPVDKMPLLEIIMGAETSQSALAAALDFSLKIGKTPIVVNDSRGFFTSRVFGTFTSEAALMLEEGVCPVLIENAARTAGFPVSPLAVTDEVSLSLCLHVLSQTPAEEQKADSARLAKIYTALTSQGRSGKKAGAGFYDYPQEGKKSLWLGLDELFPPINKEITAETVALRLLTIMALESYRCLEEGVLHNAKDGDVGSILGFGFPPYTGGVFSYIDYVGKENFIATCLDFSQRFGARFTPPKSLLA